MLRNWAQNQEEQLNMWLGNNVILAARQKQDQILISSPIATIDKSQNQNQILFAKNNKYPQSCLLKISYF